MIETVRRFIAREVIPVASELEHADTYPEAIVEQMKALGLFGITIPEEYGGLGLDLLTYIGVIEELAYGWMSLSGIVNTHTIAAYLVVHHGSDAQKERWLPRLADGRAPRLPVAVGIRRGERHAQPRVPRRARRRGVRGRRHEDVGHQRRARGDRRARGPHRRRHQLLHRREGARADAAVASP